MVTRRPRPYKEISKKSAQGYVRGGCITRVTKDMEYLEKTIPICPPSPANCILDRPSREIAACDQATMKGDGAS